MRQYEKYVRWLPRPCVWWLRDRYLSALDLRDRLEGRAGDLIPPRSLHFIGDGDFRKIGETFFHYFVERCELRPDERVLDIGCGTGRMAIPLLPYLDPAGRYVGFDVSRKAIDWCRRRLTVRNPRFTFEFADVRNPEYHPRGRLLATEYPFPCAAASVDFAFATSVFTHMRRAEVRGYLIELARVLKPAGRALLTFFILDETNRRLLREGRASLNFATELDDCCTIDPATPERAIAYPEDVLRRLVAEAGLGLKPPILFGSWSGRQSMLSAQDVVIVTKGA